MGLFIPFLSIHFDPYMSHTSYSGLTDLHVLAGNMNPQ